jgi:hypothetical protein
MSGIKLIESILIHAIFYNCLQITDVIRFTICCIYMYIGSTSLTEITKKFLHLLDENSNYMKYVSYYIILALGENS